MPIGQMTLKRSVSPDGHINSFSVELTIPGSDESGPYPGPEVLAALEHQESVVGEFMKNCTRNNGRERGQQRGNGTQQGNGHDHPTGPVPAVLRDVGGAQTRYGWRYFLNVDIDGRTYKLFGTPQKLSEHLAGIGLGGIPIEHGESIDQPCMAVLGKSQCGRYTNVVQLLTRDHQRSVRR